MKSCVVDSLVFDFPDDWEVAKFDDWTFYREHFSRMKDHIKASDLIALSPGKVLYLIEAKDYRAHSRISTEPIHEVILNKSLSTLAALLPAALNGNVLEEREMAQRCLKAQKIRIVFHLEQPLKRSRLFPVVIDSANLLGILRKKLKPIDPHPKIQSMGDDCAHDRFWSVRNA